MRPAYSKVGFGSQEAERTPTPSTTCASPTRSQTCGTRITEVSVENTYLCREMIEFSMLFVHYTAIWAQEQELTGDFFAQNTDVVQPGKIAPW